MSSYTKVAAGWLRHIDIEFGQEYILTALEHQHPGDGVLRFDDPQSDDPRFYYVLEARDQNVFFGAPHSGVMLYHVAYDDAQNHTVVNTVLSKTPETLNSNPVEIEYPTLHGLGKPEGAIEYEDHGNRFRIVLLDEQVALYRATIRIERLGKNPEVLERHDSVSLMN